MFVLFIFGLFLGTATVEQIHFDKCKAQNFPQPVCSIEKKLNDTQK